MSKRNRALKKPDRINPDDLQPGIAAGLTQGASAEEALAEFPVQKVSGIEVVRHMGEVKNVVGTRVPTPRFVASENSEAIMVEENTGRVMKDAIVTLQPETLRAIKAGNICLRCYEPQPVAFPELCDLCGYPMAERQIMDVAMELTDDRHLGPSKPMNEYLDEQEARVEKARFDQAVREGKSPLHGLH